MPNADKLMALIFFATLSVIMSVVVKLSIAFLIVTLCFIMSLGRVSFC